MSLFNNNGLKTRKVIQSQEKVEDVTTHNHQFLVMPFNFMQAEDLL
jgi:hypothetical protein